MPKRKALLISVTGPDQPGITAALTEIMAESDVRLLRNMSMTLRHLSVRI